MPSKDFYHNTVVEALHKDGKHRQYQKSGGDRLKKHL